MEGTKKKPMTGAERVRKWRAKQGETFKQCENQRIEKQRKLKLQNMSPTELKNYRQKRAEQQRAYRCKKINTCTKSPIATSSNKAYSRPQSYGKAIKRCTRSLPTSPRKRTVVVCGLAKKFGIATVDKMERALQPGNKGINADVVALITEFFYRSDVVFTMPGMKDEITIWSEGKKEKRGKYYLTLFLRECFNLFKSLHPDVEVSFSKFCKIRPQNVLLLKDTPADQCKCRLHENFRLKLKGLKVEYDSSWWEACLCDHVDLHSSCWKGQCLDCQEGKLFASRFDLDPATSTQWQQWEKKDERLQKVHKEGCIGELFELFMEALPDFQEHVRVKRIQSNTFEKDKSCSRVLEVDFAMSYSCEYQSEIQSALWSRASVTLFTAAVFYNGTCKTFLICSDSKDNGKDSVFAYLFTLYKHIMSDLPTSENVEEVIFSDGPSSEFKNKFSMKIISLLSKEFNRKFSWKFFATSHGKGVVDGVGGRAKSIVRQKVMSRDEATVVQNSQDFAKVVRSLIPSTTVLHVSEEEISSLVETRSPWNNVPSVPGIQKMHVATTAILNNGDVSVSLYHTSGQDEADILVTCNLGHVGRTSASDVAPEPQHAQISSNLNVGDWCVVSYDNELFPGEVTLCVMGECEVSVMVRSGQYWKWPARPDKVFYRADDIVRKICPPEVAGSRGQFRFIEIQ